MHKNYMLFSYSHVIFWQIAFLQILSLGGDKEEAESQLFRIETLKQNIEFCACLKQTGMEAFQAFLAMGLKAISKYLSISQQMCKTFLIM